MNITSINGVSFSGLSGFGMLIDSQTSYYIMDSNNGRIIIFDKNWKYSSTISISSPYSMITKNNYLYITSDYYIYKTDKFLNSIKQYPSNNPNYMGFRGICYNSNDNYIYAVSNNYYRIYSFDLNLNLIDSFYISTWGSPWGIQSYDNKLYVSNSYYYIYIVVNRTVINSFPVPEFVTSMLFDQFGFVATTSHYSNQINIYTSNGTYTGKSFPTVSYSRYMDFDSKNRLIVLSYFQLSIYIRSETTTENATLLNKTISNNNISANASIDMNHKFFFKYFLQHIKILALNSLNDHQ
jgi:hypothetical protein